MSWRSGCVFREKIHVKQADVFESFNRLAEGSKNVVGARLKIVVSKGSRCASLSRRRLTGYLPGASWNAPKHTRLDG